MLNIVDLALKLSKNIKASWTYMIISNMVEDRILPVSNDLCFIKLPLIISCKLFFIDPVNEGRYIVADITTPFNVENCPVLENKPKVFLLNSGLEEEDLPGEHSMEEDFLIAIANKKEYDVHRDANGCFFTQSVVRQLWDGLIR